MRDVEEHARDMVFTNPNKVVEYRRYLEYADGEPVIPKTITLELYMDGKLVEGPVLLHNWKKLNGPQ